MAHTSPSFNLGVKRL